MSVYYEIVTLTTDQPETHAVVRIDLEDKTESGGLEAVVIALCFSEEEAETHRELIKLGLAS